MANPYLIAGALLGIGVIGEWLLGGQSSSTTRPDAMPQANSAVRGSPVYVTFGGNRVYPQVTWTKNFNAVRQSGSGKGGAKGGGSGGFGSMKGGGTAGQEYEYYWDMMFNFGMFDVPCVVTQGWIGGDAISDDSIKAILNGGNLGSGKTNDDNYFDAIIDYMKALATQVTQSNDGTAHLKFTSCFFAPGYNTGDPLLTNWSYFQAQEGVACAFPGTCWVGFQQLDLGQSSAVPQLSMEFIPQSLNVLSGDGFIMRSNFANDGNFGDQYNGRGFLRDDNGRFYHLDWRSGPAGTSQRAMLIDITTHNETATYTEAQFETDSAGVTWQTTIPVPDSKYFYMHGEYAYATNSTAVVAYLYQVNTDGSISYTGKSAEWRYDALDFHIPHGSNILAIYRQSDGRLLCVFIGSFSATYYTTVQALPNPDAMIDPALSGGGWTNKAEIVEFHDASDFECCMGDCGSQRTNNMQAGFVAADTADSSWLCFYVGKAEMDYHAAHSAGDLGYVKYIGDLQATYPTGMMVMARITITDNSLGYSDVGVNNSYFLNAAGSPLIPYADQGEDFDGNATGSNLDDWFTPSGGGFVIVSRGYSNDFYTYRYDMLRNNGMFAQRDDTHRLSETLTVGEIGTTGMTKYISTTISQTGAIFATIDYNTSGGNPGTVQVNLGKATIDVTPAYIVYRILTSEFFGFQTEALFGYSVTADRIDQASYEQAVEWCVSQGIYVSVTYTRQDNLLSILNELVSLYNGFLTDIGGVIKFGVVTGSDQPVRVLDNSHLIAEKGRPPVKIVKAALEDGFNRIKFNFIDRSLNYNQNQVQKDDEVDQDINTIRTKTYDARFVMAGSVADQIANRALWQNLYGKDQLSLVYGWKDADLTQGDLVTIVDSFDPALAGGVRARLIKVRNTKRGRYEATAVREFPYIITASTFFTQTSTLDQGFGGLVDPIKAPFKQTCYELPQEFQDSKAHVYFGYEQASIVMGAQLYISKDGANYILTQDTQPFNISGVLGQPLPLRDRGYAETNIDFFLFPTSGFNANSPTFVQTYDLDDVTRALRAAGAGNLIVGSECIAFETLTLLGQNHYRAKRMFRGWGGTPISDHSSGDWFHQHAAGIFIHEISQSDIGTNFSYKIVPYNFAGDLYDISSINASSYAIKGTYWLPRPVGTVQIYPSSPLAAKLPLDGPYFSAVSGGCDVNFSWLAASNKDGFGAQGYGFGGFGHFEPDQGGVSLPSYRVEVQSINGFTVRSTVVNTGWFNYPLLSNSADFVGVANDFQVKVTAINNFGDGISDTRTLHMGL